MNAPPPRLLAPHVIAASVRGAGHIRRGQPNQDCAGAERFDDDAWAIVVSDGHGAELHARSGDGSRLAVQAALAELRRIDWRVASGGAAAVATLVDAIVELWRDKVEADLDERPLDAQTLAASEAAGLGQYGPYGATLVAAAVRGEDLLLLQIGDGDLYVRGADGGLERPLPDDVRAGEETASLCMPSAQAEARWRIIPRPAQVMAATDGFSKSFTEPAEALDAASALLGRVREGIDAEAVQRDLSALSERGSSDDISIAAWLAEAAAMGGDDQEATPLKDEQKPGPLAWAPWAALAAVALAAVIAWQAGWIGPAPKPPPPVAPPIGMAAGNDGAGANSGTSDRRPARRHEPAQRGPATRASGPGGDGHADSGQRGGVSDGPSDGRPSR